MILTSTLPALLHPILIDVQCEQHVRVAPLVLLHVGPASAAGSDGCVQEEGGFLCGWGAQLTLVLELPWRSRRSRERTGLRWVKEIIKRRKKRTDVRRILKREDT